MVWYVVVGYGMVLYGNILQTSQKVTKPTKVATGKVVAREVKSQTVSLSNFSYKHSQAQKHMLFFCFRIVGFSSLGMSFCFVDSDFREKWGRAAHKLR